MLDGLTAAFHHFHIQAAQVQGRIVELKRFAGLVDVAGFGCTEEFGATEQLLGADMGLNP